jgi:hypothetical protein
MENEYPGLWRLWFKNQCVTDGHSPYDGKKWLMVGGKRDHDWIVTRNALQEIEPDHLIIVALPGRRIGRIGKVLSNKSKDEDWDPLYEGDSDWERGYMGRRITVHWELENAPDNPDQVIQLPERVNLGRGTLHRVHDNPDKFRKFIANPANWVDLAGLFGYEWALSDFIALYPNRLRDGLKAYPDAKKIREKIFKDRSRVDVLLRDENKNGEPVIVECKRESPDVEAVRQLKHYINRLKDETDEKVSGILVHGGARTVDKKVWQEAKKSPHVEIFQYKLDVEFTPSLMSP